MEITNEILLERLENLIEQNTNAHVEVNAHLKQLNGSVGSLKMWRSFITGGLAVLSAILVPVALMVFANYIK